MNTIDTNALFEIQAVCNRGAHNFVVTPSCMSETDVKSTGKAIVKQRDVYGWSQGELAQRITGLMMAEGSSRIVKQQSVDQLEKGKLKSVPDWVRFAWRAFEDAQDETARDLHLHNGKTDNSVMIKLLPTFVGLGNGGTGDDDEGEISFSRDLIENELRVPSEALLAMVAEGNSMEPEFRGGDQILVDTRRKSLAQPGAFCLWDGDGHVIKYLERVHDSEPPRVRVISANSIYDPRERLVDEVNIIGRVCWFGRRVQ